jgi:hypothetical protein
MSLGDRECGTYITAAILVERALFSDECATFASLKCFDHPVTLLFVGFSLYEIG